MILPTRCKRLARLASSCARTLFSARTLRKSLLAIRAAILAIPLNRSPIPRTFCLARCNCGDSSYRSSRDQGACIVGITRRHAPGTSTRTEMKMFHVAFAVAAILGAISTASGQAYPSHPLSIVVGFSAGGPTDTLARNLAEPMRRSLGQPVVIENVTGAAGSIAIARVGRATPDGYTLILGNWNSHVVAVTVSPTPYVYTIALHAALPIRRPPLSLLGAI